MPALSGDGAGSEAGQQAHGSSDGGVDNDGLARGVTRDEPFDQRKRPRERIGRASSWETVNELEQERAFLVELYDKYREHHAPPPSHAHVHGPFVAPPQTSAAPGPGSSGFTGQSAEDDPRWLGRGPQRNSQWIQVNCSTQSR